MPPDATFPPRESPASPEMAARVREHPWNATSLGPMPRWPESLKIAVGICLSSRFPMFVWWGPELLNIYNDAYVPILGDKHPRALGRPARESWREIWDVVGLQAAAVMERGEATWNDRVLLTMQRHGFTEDTWFTWSYSPIHGEDGRVGGVFCACYEETGRVLAERERDRLMARVEGERARLAEAFAQSPSFLAVLTGRDMVFEFVNQRYRELVGDRELLGRPAREALPEMAGQGFFEILDRVYATGEPYIGSGVAVQIRRPAAPALETAYLDFVYQPTRGADGRVNGILAHGVDVTDRHVSEQRFRQLADAMPQMVFIADRAGRILYFNRQWQEYTGIAADGETDAAWRETVVPADRAAVEDVWREALRTGERYEMECRIVRHDGAPRWQLVRALPIRGEDGRVQRWYGTITDIDDRKRIEVALGHALRSEQEAREEAERASRMKDEFLATLSHELRTPLNAILGWSHMIRVPNVAPEQLRHGAEVIERNARAQSKIIEDLLDMSAIISGKVRLEPRRLELAPLVRSAVDTARPTAQAKAIALEARVDALEGAFVQGDADRLQQVLWNLLTNAVKFTPREGRIEIDAARGEGGFQVSVADTGPGIEPAFLPFIFDRFRQADASTTREHGGLGLGLSIVKQLVELHGGSVRAQNRAGGAGARFTVTLPEASAFAGVGDGDGAGEAAQPAVEIPPADRERVAGLSVLVVDDEPDARDLVKSLLRSCGAQVHTAGSSAEALALLGRQRYDVLVSDVGMPGEDGYTLMRKVRASHPAANADIPAVALTAYARAEDRVKALHSGFQMHAAKPLDPAELVAIVALLGAPAGRAPVAQV